jgi:hypothetical protein
MRPSWIRQQGFAVGICVRRTQNTGISIYYNFDSRKLVLFQMNIFTVIGGYRKTYYESWFRV